MVDPFIYLTIYLYLFSIQMDSLAIVVMINLYLFNNQMDSLAIVVLKSLYLFRGLPLYFNEGFIERF